MKKVLAVVIALAAGSALAASSPQTTTFTVQVNVAKSCTVSSTTLDFISYDPLVTPADTTVDNPSGITMTCSKGTTYTIALNGGSNGFPRKMNGPVAAEKLTYLIYRDAARTQLWGDGTTGTPLVLTAANKNANPIPMYGTITAGQDVTQGAYTDSVTATVTF